MSPQKRAPMHVRRRLRTAEVTAKATTTTTATMKMTAQQQASSLVETFKILSHDYVRR
jgi:hypothetical protein